MVSLILSDPLRATKSITPKPRKHGLPAPDPPNPLSGSRWADLGQRPPKTSKARFIVVFLRLSALQPLSHLSVVLFLEQSLYNYFIESRKTPKTSKNPISPKCRSLPPFWPKWSLDRVSVEGGRSKRGQKRPFFRVPKRTSKTLFFSHFHEFVDFYNNYNK